MQQKVILCQGLPACGKSTYARGLVLQNENWVRVNKDDIRAMLHNNRFSRSNEKLTVAARNFMITDALTRGYNVVVDDTNFAGNVEHIKHVVNEWWNAHPHDDLLGKDYPEIEVKKFPVPLSVCLGRNALREGYARVPEEVILRMFNSYVKGTDLEVPE